MSVIPCGRALHAEDRSGAQADLSKIDIPALAANPEWRALLHCLPLHSKSCRSRVASAKFFLAPDGAENPTAELQATIKSFFDSAHAQAPETPSRCAYPARFEWIKSQIDPSLLTLPDPACPALATWMEAINPEGLTLIFPSSFINNPASAFGHTLLRIDQPGQTEDTRLLAYTANFAAATQGEAALLYAFKGVFGGYDGFFSVAPYYEKVTKYSDLENRDIWEYPLDFSKAEVRRVVLHVWELRNVPFYYYYFDENCSYQLLSLLEIARPNLDLSAELNLWVIPVDTIRALQEREGLLKGSIFRPSLATKLRHEISLTPRDQALIAKSLADTNRELDASKLDSFNVQEKAHILDIAYDMITYTRIRERRDDEESRTRAWKLLSMRSALSKAAPLPPPPAPATRPEMGHGTMKLTAGFGQEDGLNFGTLGFRGAFHDQLDQIAGYLPGAQIKFLDLTLRYDEDEHLNVDRFTFFDIESLSPQDTFFHPLSWNVRLGSEREHISKHEWTHVWSLQAGGGASATFAQHGLLYALLEGEFQSSTQLHSAAALGIGPRAGFVVPFTATWALEGKTLFEYFVAGDEHTKFQSSLMQRVSLDSHFALRFGAQHVRDLGENSNRAMLEIEYFATPVW